VVGSLFHNVIEQWSYSGNSKVLLEATPQLIERWIPNEWRQDCEGIQEEVFEMLRTFVRSEAYAELSGATILGREIPFLMPWGDRGQLMEGRIDLLYEREDGLWVADYKTDRVLESELADRAEAYRCQARIYLEAVRRAVGREPDGFKFIFVRSGKAVPVSV